MLIILFHSFFQETHKKTFNRILHLSNASRLAFSPQFPLSLRIIKCLRSQRCCNETLLFTVEENEVHRVDVTCPQPMLDSNRAPFPKTLIWAWCLLDTKEAPSTYCMNIRHSFSLTVNFAFNYGKVSKGGKDALTDLNKLMKNDHMPRHII